MSEKKERVSNPVQRIVNCKTCGSDNVGFAFTIPGGGFIECKSCGKNSGFTFGGGENEEEAIKVWNLQNS